MKQPETLLAPDGQGPHGIPGLSNLTWGPHGEQVVAVNLQFDGVHIEEVDPNGDSATQETTVTYEEAVELANFTITIK